MQILVNFLFVLIAAFFLPSLSLAKELVYIPLPIEDKESVVADHTPMAQYLAEKLGVPVRVHYENDYKRIIQLFQEGKADLAQLGPLPYVTLKKGYPQASALVVMNEADGKPTYTCAMVTGFDGPQSLEQLHSPLALPQPLSTCGHFSATLLLKNHHQELKKLGYHYVGNHSNVALAVIRGEFAAGVMKTSVARKYGNLALRVVEETTPQPGLLMVANTATLNEEQRQRLGQALIEASVDSRSSWVAGKEGFSPVAEGDFTLFLQSLNEEFSP